MIHHYHNVDFDSYDLHHRPGRGAARRCRGVARGTRVELLLFIVGMIIVTIIVIIHGNYNDDGDCPLNSTFMSMLPGDLDPRTTRSIGSTIMLLRLSRSIACFTRIVTIIWTIPMEFDDDNVWWRLHCRPDPWAQGWRRRRWSFGALSLVASSSVTLLGQWAAPGGGGQWWFQHLIKLSLKSL